MHWGLTLAKTVWVHSGDVHFSHGYCHPPPPRILLPIALQLSEQTERVVIQQKNWEVFFDGSFNLKHVND